MSFTGIGANASSEDVQANQADIVALQTSVNAKPSVAQVDAQIGVLNTAQNQAISLQYQDRVTNYDISQTDGLLLQKASVSGLAAVQAQVQSLPSLTDVQNQIDAKNAIQDVTTLLTFQDRATSITSATAASTYATQSSVYTTAQSDATNASITSLIGQANSNIADIYLGNLIGLNVYNPAASGSNTLEVRCRPDASANQASLQIVHDHTASGSRAKLGFWDQTISGSSSTAPSTALTLAWDGDADTHTSTFSGGLTVVGTIACTNLIATGIVTMPASSASPGDVLKSNRFQISGASWNMTNVWYSVFTHAHAPSNSSSYLDITFTGLWRLNPTNQGNNNGEWRISVYVDGTSVGDCFIRNDGAAVVGNTGPLFGRYTNTSLASKSVEVRAIQTNHFQTSKFYLQYTHIANSNWLHIEEVAR